MYRLLPLSFSLKNAIQDMSVNCARKVYLNEKQHHNYLPPSLLSILT